MKKHLFLIVLVCSLFVACKPKAELPTVSTLLVDLITENSASCAGEIIHDGYTEIISQGFCWATTQDPTLNDNVVEGGYTVLLQEEPAPKCFEAELSGLTASTKYYVRAYATNSEGTAYGESFCFVTLDETEDGDEDGNEGGDDNGGDDNGGNDNGGDDNGGDDNGGDDNGGDDNGGDDNGGEIVVELPTITTVVVSGVTINSAMLSAEVLTDGGADVTERGFYWNKANASEEATFVKVGDNLGAYTYQLTNLQELTEYNVGAYAVNSAGMVKSEIVAFTTLKNEDDDDDDDETEYVYVDLGLPSGTLWAEHNVGALFPEGYGDHFAWGEIEPKNEYTSDNCSSYQQDLGDISGNPMFDAATANWGDDWRMPTLEEMFELTQNCTWTWTEVNGVAGYKVASKTNDNYIFLPASGFRVNGDLLDQNTYGYYWTSTPYDPEGSTPTYTKGCYLDMCSYQLYCDWALRRNGFTVRPVRNN